MPFQRARPERVLFLWSSAEFLSSEKCDEDSQELAGQSVTPVSSQQAPDCVCTSYYLIAYFTQKNVIMHSWLLIAERKKLLMG